MKWAIFAAFALLLLGIGFIGTTSAATIHYVPDNYTTIQAAVNAASPGDIVIVRDGTYVENVDVNVDHLTIKSEKGADSTIVQAADPADHVFELTEDYVNISGFTVKDATVCGMYLGSADYCNIFDDIVLNNYRGIDLYDSSNNTITNNTANWNSYGVYLHYSSNYNTITNNTARNSHDGIDLYDSSNNMITNNTANGNSHDGIHLSRSSNNTITNNTANGNRYIGIELSYSSNNNTLTNNTANSNSYSVPFSCGVYLSYSSNNTLLNNNVSNNYKGIRLFHSSNNTITNNTVNSNSHGGILFYSSSNNTLTNNTANENVNGIHLYSSSNNTLTNNTANLNRVGIPLSHSSNNTLTDNTANSNIFEGIVLSGSSNNTLTDNTANWNKEGIYLYSSNNTLTNNTANWNREGIILFCHSSNNTLTNNTANWNVDYGIYLYDSSNNTLTNNTANWNRYYGIKLSSSSNYMFTNNIMSGNGYNFGVSGYKLSHYIHNIDTSNEVDGKPVYYWVDRQDGQIPDDAGFVGIVNSTNIMVRDLTLTNNGQGVLFAYTKNSGIKNITASNNRYGIYLHFSSNNTLTNNTANANKNWGIYLSSSNNNNLTNNTPSNNDKGIRLTYSSNNHIYLNNFIDNSENVHSASSTNVWNSTEKITYTYDGNTYTNYTGNYWDDCTAIDANNDGIWDTPYPIDSDNDNYPLMEPFENYFGEVEEPTEFWVEVSNPAGVGAYICNDSVDFTFGRNLKRGDSGDDVKYLQIVLNANPATQVAVDGPGSPCHETNYFGELTEAAVIKFQTLHGLTQSGEVDDDTRAELNKLYLPVKHVPNGWVLKVTNTHQNKEIHDGCVWWEVEDVTDGIKGWVAYQKISDGTKYLNKGDQEELRNRIKKLNSKDERIPVILEAANHYYNNEDTTSSLYSSNDKNNHLSIFTESNFPIELILAMAAVEALSDFDNEFVSYDCGRGIAQITINGYVGISNNIRCYSGGEECLQYEYTGNIVDKNLNISRDGELQSYCHGSCCCYYYKDSRGRCIRVSSADCSICENTNDEIGNENDCGQEWCKDEYGNRYATNKCDEEEKCENMEKCECWRCTCRRNVNCKCKHYTNITQGVHANIKDELRVLQEKYEWSRGIIWEAKRTTCDDSPVIITSEDFEKIVGIWGYNGITLERNYLRDVANKLLELDSNSYYGENYKEHLKNTISDEDLKIWACKLKWANDNRGSIKSARLKSPGELRVYDFQGRVTGLVNGEIKNEVPGSEYSNGTVTILFPSDSYRYEVAGTDEGTYGSDITSVEDGNVTIFTATDIPTTDGATHQYAIDWDALSQGKEGVTVQVDSDGDGTFEDTFTADNELSRDEFLSATNDPPIADANDPYFGFIGEPITLDGTGSYDPDGIIVSYEWDLDDDGEFDDAFGQTPTITFDEPYSGDIHLKVIDDNGATDIDTTTLTVEEAEDTTPPTIVSVTLDAYTTIPDATIHVTVEATDNVGVTSVTADGVALGETGGIWEGNITAPSATGDYTLTIIAEDEAENFDETTVDYLVVKPSGSIGIGVDPRLTMVSAGDTAIINIKLVSTENFDDIAYVYLSTDGLPAGYQADLTWFNWTSKYVKVPKGGEVKVPLEASILAGESGYKVFYAKLESTKWTPTAMDTGILYIT